MKKTYLLVLFYFLFGFIFSDAQTPAPISHDNEPIRGAVFSSDSQRIISWSGNSVRVWELQTGAMRLEIVISLHAPQSFSVGSINSAQWNEDESQIIINFQEASHSLIRSRWDAETGEFIASENLCTGLCGSQENNPSWPAEAWDNTGQRQAQWHNEICREACEFDLILTEADGSQSRLSHQNRVKNAYWSASGRYLATSTVPDCIAEENCFSSLYIWSVEVGAESYGHLLASVSVPCLAWDIAWTSDESRFFVRSDGLWRVPFEGSIAGCGAVWQSFSIEGELLWAYEDSNWGFAQAMKLTADESRLVIHGRAEIVDVSAPAQIIALDAETGSILETVEMDGFVSERLAAYYSPYAPYAYQLSATELLIWDAESLEELKRFPLASSLATFADDYGNPIPHLYWFPEFSLAYAITTDNQVYVWDMASWEQIFYLGDPSLIQNPHFDEQTGDISIRTAESDCQNTCASSAWLIDAQARRMVFSISLPDESIYSVRQLGDSYIVVSTGCADCDDKLYIYEGDSSALILQDSAERLVEIQDRGENWLLVRERLPFIEGEDPANPLRLWNLETGELMLELDAYAYQLSPQREKILVYGEEATAIYELTTGQLFTEFAFPAGNRGLWAWSPDERFIVFKVGGDTLADVYSAETGTWLFPNRQG